VKGAAAPTPLPTLTAGEGAHYFQSVASQRSQEPVRQQQDTRTQGAASSAQSQWRAPCSHSEQNSLLKALLKPRRRIRGEQRAPAAGPDLRQSTARHGSPKARRRGRAGKRRGGHSCGDRKEQRRPLGFGQSLPSQPSSHLLQSQRTRPAPGAAQQPCRAQRRRRRATQADPTGSRLSAPGSRGKSPHGAGARGRRGWRRGAL